MLIGVKHSASVDHTVHWEVLIPTTPIQCSCLLLTVLLAELSVVPVLPLSKLVRDIAEDLLDTPKLQGRWPMNWLDLLGGHLKLFGYPLESSPNS